MNTRNAAIGIGLIVLLISVTLGIILLIDFEPPSTPPTENRPPQLTVVNPTSGSTLSGIVQINITVIDEETLVPDIYIDGTLEATSNLYDWDTASLPDGRHTIRVEVQDSSELSDRKFFQITIDNVEESPHVFDGTFKIMCYNIKESGKDDDWKTVVKAENPDLIVVVETGYWDDSANEDLNAAVSELNAYFVDETPYDGYCTQNVHYSTSGEAILSRFPVKQVNQLGLVPLDDGTNYDVTHDFIEAVIDINGTDVHVFGGHLKASDGETNEQRREWEQEGINNYMDSLGDVPILYLSDQNSFAPVDIGPLAGEGMELGFGPMTMMLDPTDPTYGQYSCNEHTFTDVFRTLNPNDPGFTYGQQDTAVSVRIDFIIVNSFFEDMLVNSTIVTDSPAFTASDHYAITAFLDWLGGG